MKKLNNKGYTLSELLAIPLMVLIVGLVVFSLVSIGCGLILAFKASIVLGIIVLLVEPLPGIIGLVYLLTGNNLAQRFIEWLTKG